MTMTQVYLFNDFSIDKIKQNSDQYNNKYMKNWTIFEADTIFTFGKYKGYTLDYVATQNISYILWCVKNIEKFLISEEDLTEYCNKSKSNIISILTNPNEDFVNSMALFLVSENDLIFLKKKWEDYEEYFEMQSNADDDYYDDYSLDNNPYYNDNLDMDQQDPEFWDWF